MKEKGSIETIIAVLALLISLVAVYFTREQLEVSRLHNRLSVKPILDVTPHAEGTDGRNGFYLTNVGLGPAILTSFSASTGDLSMEGFGSDRWQSVLNAAEANENCFATGWPREAAALKSGDEIALFEVTSANDSEFCFAEMIKLMGGVGIDVKVGYQSIYKEEWVKESSTRVESQVIKQLRAQLQLLE